MKTQLFVLTISTVLSMSAFAQNQKNSAPTQGSNPQVVSAAVCNQLIPQIRPQADSCLKVKDLAQRSQCFDQVGKTIQKTAPNGACDQILNPIKQEYIAKEKQLYPNQGSALNGPSGGNGNSQPNMGTQPNMGSQPSTGSNQPKAGTQPNMGSQPSTGSNQPKAGTQPNMGSQPSTGSNQPKAGTQPNMGSQPTQAPKMSAAECDKLGKTVTPMAEACLKIKDQPARAQCFDQIGQMMQKTAPNGGCDQFLNPLKQAFMAKEKQLYPKQTPALK